MIRAALIQRTEPEACHHDHQDSHLVRLQVLVKAMTVSLAPEDLFNMFFGGGSGFGSGFGGGPGAFPCLLLQTRSN